MNKSGYFNYIEEKLNELSYCISIRGKMNLLDLNIYSESFFAELTNYLLKCNLVNINTTNQNTEGIDLIDKNNKILAQVSATCTKQKIENSLSKKIFEKYPDYRFKFIAIAGDAGKLKKETFKNPHNILFVPSEDIYDIKSLLDLILEMSAIQQRELYEFIKSELGNQIDIVKVDTNLATIINILSNEDLTDIVESPEINSFEIFRKIEYNDLLSVQSTIDDYKIYYSRVNEKYIEFDKQGANKSLSILNVIRKQYIQLEKTIQDAHELFFAIIDNVIGIIGSSKNYVEIPYDELEMCTSILVVDAFIRCKIFKNPEGYSHVIAR